MLTTVILPPGRANELYLKPLESIATPPGSTGFRLT
jgi:hypothetical protein